MANKYGAAPQEGGEGVPRKSSQRKITELCFLLVGLAGLVYSVMLIIRGVERDGSVAYTAPFRRSEIINLLLIAAEIICIITGAALILSKARVESKKISLRRVLAYIKRYWMLYVMLIPPMAFFVVFRYVPMVNIVMAFKEDNIFRPVFENAWVGFDWFTKAFESRDFLRAVRNTIWLNFLDLLVGFPGPIVLAILLNELAFKTFKKLTQTILYMPHFLSWIIISGMAMQLFLPSGLVNDFLVRNGMEVIPFFGKDAYWTATYIGLGVWQSIGWNTIIYLAAIVGINPELYEAAAVDGANRMQKIWHVTLPGLRPTIVVLLILNLGRMLGSDFDRPWALGNNLVRGTVANVLSTHVYQVGISSFQYSLATAIGLFQSVVCVIFLLGANGVAKRLGERGIL
jgi:putative aldouronate transport system permease protein